MEITEWGLANVEIAFGHLNRGVAPREILEILCFNCGGRPIGEVGEVTEYNPHIHEDSEGGISPGELIKVIHVGLLNPDAVKRSVEKVSTDGVNVEEKVNEFPYEKVIVRATVRRADVPKEHQD